MSKIYKTIIGNDCSHTIDMQDILHIKTSNKSYEWLYVTDIFLKNGDIISISGEMVSNDEVREFLSSDDKKELSIKDESIGINAISERK